MKCHLERMLKKYLVQEMVAEVGPWEERKEKKNRKHKGLE